MEAVGDAETAAQMRRLRRAHALRGEAPPLGSGADEEQEQEEEEEEEEELQRRQPAIGSPKSEMISK